MADIVKKATPMEEDHIKEKEFIKSLGKAKVPDLKKELDIMIACYNQQLEQLVRYRVDLETMDYMILAKPGDDKLLKGRAETNLMLAGKRKIVKVLRGQILERIKEVNGKKN